MTNQLAYYRWEQIHDGDEEARLLGRRRPSEAISENGPIQNGVRRKEPYASVENQSFTRVCRSERFYNLIDYAEA